MTETYGYDKTPTPPRDYDVSKVPPEIKKRTEWVKSKFTGEDVAEAYRQAGDIAGIYAGEAKKIAENTNKRHDNLEAQTAQSVAQMEADKDAVIANATVDSEVILARGGKPTLQARLDETTAQLAQTIQKNELIINVKDFGAKGDLKTDDYEAIQEAIDYLFSISISGGVIYFPKGIYSVSNPLNTYNAVALNTSLESVDDNYQGVSNGPSTHIKFLGDTKDNTLIKSMGGDNIVKPKKNGHKAMYRFTSENIRYVGAGNAFEGIGTPFDFYSSTGYPKELLFKNCDFNFFDTGFEFDRYKRESSLGGIHVMLSMEHCNFGMNNTGSMVNADDTDFYKCRFERNHVFGLHVSGGNRISVEKSKIQYNAINTNGLEGGQIKLSGRITNISFNDCYIENKGTSLGTNDGSTIFYIDDSIEDTFVYNIGVNDCYINCFSGDSLINAHPNVAALRGIDFRGGVVRNIKPLNEKKELMVIPNNVEVYTINFETFIEDVLDENDTRTDDWILTANNKVSINNGYKNAQMLHSPLTNTNGGSLEIVMGSVNANGTQKYFGYNSFNVTKLDVGEYEITLMKDNVSTLGGNTTWFPVIATPQGNAKNHAYTVPLSSSSFKVIVRNSNDEKIDSPFSFVAFTTVK